MRLAIIPLVLAVLASTASPGRCGERPVGWEAALAEAQPIALSARPVRLAGGRLRHTSLVGVWVLTADRPEFGAFSGLLMRDGYLYAVSDHAWWLGVECAEQDGRLVLRNARMAPLRDPTGAEFRKADGDAEGLTWSGDHLMVSFERDHRIMRLGSDGRMQGASVLPAFAGLKWNRGLEALASLPDARPPGGGLIALAEGRDKDETPVFVIRPDGSAIERRLRLGWLHAVTGADVGPDGRLYLVMREFSVLFGVSIRVMRYELGEDGVPRAESAELLAAFEGDSGIDNMEGIAVERRADGGARLWLISDDNFQTAQRTLLVALDVTP